MQEAKLKAWHGTLAVVFERPGHEPLPALLLLRAPLSLQRERVATHFGLSQPFLLTHSGRPVSQHDPLGVVWDVAAARPPFRLTVVDGAPADERSGPFGPKAAFFHAVKESLWQMFHSAKSLTLAPVAQSEGMWSALGDQGAALDQEMWDSVFGGAGRRRWAVRVHARDGGASRAVGVPVGNDTVVGDLGKNVVCQGIELPDELRVEDAWRMLAYADGCLHVIADAL